MAKWRMSQGPAGTLDGSGMVALDIWGITDEGNIIPGRHISGVMVPHVALTAALALTPNSAVVAAIKGLLGDELPDGWADGELNEIVDENTDAAVVADNLNTFITVELGKEYPLDFSL